MLSYVVIASTTGQELDPAWVERVSVPEVRELPFRPDQYLTWKNRSGSVHVSGWQAFGEIGGIGTPWFIDGPNLTAFSGVPLCPGTGWARGRSWAEQLAAMIASRGMFPATHTLAGAFTVVSLARDGAGQVAADPTSSGLLYGAETEGVVVVSNQASLVARAITPADETPERDWTGPGWLFFTSQPLSLETGFAGVLTLPRNAYLDIDSSGRARIKHQADPHELPADTAISPSSWSDVVDQLACSLGASMRGLAAAPFADRELQLDGGPASRLILACVLHEGLEDQFTLRLMDERASPDAAIASAVAAAAGLPLRCDEREPESSEEFERRMRLQAFQVDGCLATDDWPSQLLAANTALISTRADGALPLPLLPPFASATRLPDRLGLTSRWNPLRPEVQEHYLGLLAESNATDSNGTGGRSGHAPGSLTLAALRRRLGPYSQTYAAPKINPLVNVGLWRMLSGSADPDADVMRLSVDIIKRRCPDLAEIPFSAPGDRSIDQDGRERQTFIERYGSLLETYLLDRSNPVRDLVQPTAIERLLRGNDPFAKSDQVLLGALTASIWLGRHERKIPIDRSWREPIQTQPVELDVDDFTSNPIEALRRLERIDPVAWSETIVAASPGPPLTEDARVLAVIPHFQGERWLADCIEALLQQTRPLQGIVVIDDASDPAPREIVERYPMVTLLQAEESSGPYRMIDQVMMATDYDAFLLQDADDFSATDRLELLLAEAIRTGAEMVGSQGLRILVDEGEVVTYTNPQNASAALEKRPSGNPMHHPACLIARDLIVRLGGFCTGLRFSGDTEFLRRASHVAQLMNVPQFAYMYRTHGSSLTGSAATGLDTPIRRNLWRLQHDRAERNAARRAAGLSPLLMPMAVSSPVELTHLSGPPLTGLGGDPWPAQRTPTTLVPVVEPAVSIEHGESPGSSSARTPRPVFIIGAPRSGISMLATCLGQHSNLTQILDPGWLPGIAESLQRHYEEGLLPRVTSHLAMTGIEPEDFIAHLGASLNELLLHGPDPAVAPPAPEWDAIVPGPLPRSRARRATRWVTGSAELTQRGFALFRLFPHARFIHIVRDPHEVVASLSNPDGKRLYRSHYVATEPNRAYEIWMERVEAAHQLEQALGADYVQRIERRDLMADPEDTIRRCLGFLDEPFERACLRPLI